MANLNEISSSLENSGKSPPQIPEREWAETVPVSTISSAKILIEKAASIAWEFPILKGKVQEGARKFLASLNLRSRTFVKGECSCEVGASGRICKHALAIYFAYFSEIEDAKKFEEKALKNIEKMRAQKEETSVPENENTGVPENENSGVLAGEESVPEGKKSEENSVAPEQKILAVPATEKFVVPEKIEEKSASQRTFTIPRDGEVRKILAKNFASRFAVSEASKARDVFRKSPQKRVPERKIAAAEAKKLRLQIDGNINWISVILPEKTSRDYETILEKIKLGGFDLDVRAARWFLRGEHAVLCFLSKEWEDFRERFSPKISPEFNNFVQSLRFAKLKTNVEDFGENFEISMHIETFGVPANEVDRAFASSRPYVKQKNGKIVLIPGEICEKMEKLRERLDRGARYSAGTPVFRRRISTSELASAEAVFDEIGINFERPETWKKRSGALRDLSKLVPAPVPEPLSSQLRIYQQIGVAWLWHLQKHKLGGVLADEMGLGKTVEAIAFIAAVFSEIPAEEAARILVVAPAGLVENWRREISRFAPEIPVLVHHGQNRSNENLSRFLRGVVLTSYAVLRIDNEDFFVSGTWKMIIADEAQQVKNRRSRNSKALREIPAETRFVLTGTPVENSLEDLRTIFDFVLPGMMPKPAASGGGVPLSELREREANQVRSLAAPYILRRTKSFVAPELPQKIEQKVWCEFDEAQAKFYADWKEKSHKEIFELEMSGASDNKLRFAAFSQLLRLRQICTEPRLLDPEFPAESSTKLRALRELLDEAIPNGHRVLVFSQFVTVLNFLKDALREDEIEFEYIDGQTKNRTEICERFNNSSVPVCLISLKAGGVGLNLTGADIVVHCDPWWNPAIEAQATDRAHRIGQKRTVTSIKLVVANSVEERVLELQDEKRALIRSVFEASDFESAKISLAEIKSLLE